MDLIITYFRRSRAMRIVGIITLVLLMCNCGKELSEYQSLSEDNRCEAITKAGKRCKRRAQVQSHYCWQHQNLEKTYGQD
jgi:hypothetical protein